MRDERFWIVWCPTGQRPPQARHYSYGTALAEARRLAAQHKGAEFFVCEVLSVSRSASVETVDLHPPVEIPF